MYNDISFDTKRIAQGYAKRPWIHKEVIAQVQKCCGVNREFENGLDVGCGAGLSSKALKLICRQVTGTDISEEMIEVCKTLYTDKDYYFYVSKAEQTIIPQIKYDVVTAAGVINWVDKGLFLENMNNVMAEKGMLVIYDFWITNKMCENESYTKWYNDEYLKEFPKPPRDESIWNPEDVSNYFTMLKQTKFDALYEFDISSFIDFMMLQSNVNVKLSTAKNTENEIREWFNDSLNYIFNNKKQKLVFEGYIWLMEKK